MKVLKRYLRGSFFAAVVFSMLIWIFCGMSNSAAADLEQSPGEVSVEIVHEHDDEACSTQVWIPCGGSWRDDHHGSHRIHYCTNQKSEEIVNGHSLSEIHSGDWYWGYSTEEHHDGGYVTEFDCDLSTLGSFAIKRTEDNGGIHLTAYTRVTNSNLGDYTISWDDGTTGAVNSAVTIDVDRRRTYTATLRWHDVRRNADFTDLLSYTDVSYPCRCEFISDDDVVEELNVRCGEKPDVMDVPEKTGYMFAGYYKDDVQWIDPDGKPTLDFRISQSDYDLTLAAKWLAKTYELKIGDEVLNFVYDEPYDDIDIAGLGLKKQGYEFSGVRIDGELIFNEDGTVAGDGIWKLDIQEDPDVEVIWDKLPDPTPTPMPTPTPTSAPEAVATESAEDDEEDEEDDHHRHHDHDEDKETAADESEPTASAVPAVSDDTNEITISEDEAAISEVIQEEDDDDNGNSPDPAGGISESSCNDVPSGGGEAAVMESAGPELPYTELFQGENDDEPALADREDDEGGPGSAAVDDIGKTPAPVWIKRVMVVAAVTCGVMGGGTAAVYAVYAGFVYLFGMASVINILPDGRKKNIGKLTVADRNGGDIEINIPQTFVDNCSTGNIEIVLPEMFVKKRDRKQLVVIINEKKYLKNIKKNVELKLFV